MAAKANSNVMDEGRKALQQADGHRKLLRDQYASEPKVDMYLSPMYRPYFGNTMRVTINGITIYFPVDGSANQVPTTFADEITRRRMAIDNMLTKQNLMAEVSGNMETAPGSLSIF